MNTERKKQGKTQITTETIKQTHIHADLHDARQKEMKEKDRHTQIYKYETNEIQNEQRKTSTSN